MHPRRSELMALAALVLAVATLVLTLQGHLAAYASPDTPNAPLAIANTLNYQGILRDEQGALVTGARTMTFRIYNDAVLSAPANVLYTQTVNDVPVRDGLFTVVLGDPTPLNASVFADGPRFIGITVAPDSQEMAPRQRLHPVPWAQQATTLVPNATVNGLTSSGDVIVNDLDIRGSSQATYFSDRADPSQSALTIYHANNQVVLGYGLLNVEKDANTIRVNGDKPVLIKRYKNVGNDAQFDTLVPADTYECVVASWMSWHDPLESRAELNAMWTYVKPTTNTWWARAQFASETTHENPHLDVLCFRKEITEWQAGNAGATRQLNQP